jgi:hypothetical protein
MGSHVPHTRGDLILGDVRFYAADQHEDTEDTAPGGVFEAGKKLDGKWRAFKTLVVLSGSEATLRVPPPDRANFLLAYDPAHVENFAYRRSAGQAAVRFVNCTRQHRTVEFPGSLLARRPGCYRVQATSRSGAILATGVVNIAMEAGACEKTANNAPRRHSAVLSRKLPAAVQSDCRWLATHATETVVCPELVPRGAASSQQPFARGSYYSANFVSKSIAGQKHLGHWSFEAGTPEDVRAVLRTNRLRGPLRPFATLSKADVPIQLFRISGYPNVHRGHVIARWFCGGRAFTVSVHGFEHAAALRAMAKDLLLLVDKVESCS